MVDGNGDDERKTKYFILSIFICVFAGSFQEKVFKIRFVSLFDPPKYLISRIIWFVELFDCPNRLIHRFFWRNEFEKTEKSMVITSLVWMVSQNLLKSDFILTMEHNKFYWMVSHWNVTILKVRDLRTDQYMKKSYIFPIVKNFELLT